MTRAATAGELVSLRSDGQWARWKALIDRPSTIYTARANGAFNATDYAIAYDGGSGTIGDCIADLTVLFGTSAGACDRCVARLRKAPAAGMFYLGPDDSLQLIQDNDYITVLDDFAPWARQPVSTLIDHDTAYTDQYTNFVPVALMGTRCCVIAAGGTADGFDASGSWVPGSTITAYSWTFTGASSTTGTTTATPTATYNTSGRYRVTLTVTAANTKTTTTYGYVYVLGASLTAETGMMIDSLEAETGMGWAARIRAYDRPTIADRARVVLYSEDYFGNTAGSIGPVAGQENILMVGWILGESIVRLPGYDLVEFTVGGTGAVCRTLATQPAGLIDSAYPSDAGADLPDWSLMASLAVRKGLHMLVNYRSTLSRCVDVTVDDYSSPAPKMSTDADNLWAQLTEYAAQGVLTPTSDRYGSLFIQRDVRLYTYASRTANIPSIMTLTDADWSGDLAITRRQAPEAALVQAEGTLYSGGEPVPTGGRSPGVTPAATGAIEQMSDVSWASAAESLEVAGLLAGALNAEYESISGSLSSNNHFIDVAPRQFVTVTIDGASVRTIPRQLRLRREPESGRVSLEMDLEGEGAAWDSEKIDYPGEDDPPPGGGSSGGGTTPPPPPPPPAEPPEPPTPGAGAAQFRGGKAYKTADITVDTPTWTEVEDFAEPLVAADLNPDNNDECIVATDQAIYHSSSFTGAGTFTKAFDGTTQFTYGTNFHLTHILYHPDGTHAYALGYATVTGGYALFCGKSSNSGVSWNWNRISTVSAPGLAWTAGATGGSDTAGVTTTITSSSHEVVLNVVFDGSANFPNSSKYIEATLDTPIPEGAAVVVSWDVQGDSPSVNYDTTGDRYALLASPDTPGTITGATQTGDTWHVEGTLNTAGRTAEQRSAIRIGYDGFNAGRWAPVTAATRNSTFKNLIIDGVSYASPAYGLAVAPTNANYVYAGISNKIFQSTDGGATWTEWVSTEGSSEIQVHPTLAGAIAFRAADDGAVMQAIGGTASALGTETASTGHGTLCYQPGSGGMLWVLNGDGDVDQRALGAWTTIWESTLYTPLSLRAYAVGGGVYKMVLQDQFTSYYSADTGATWDNKGGAGSVPAGINLFKA